MKFAVRFIPGVLFLIYLCVHFPAVKEKVAHLLWEELKITHLLLAGGVCFLAGAVIDVLRTTLISLVQRIGSLRKQSNRSSEKIHILDSLTNPTDRYLSLCFNISLTILVVWGLSLLQKLARDFWITVGSFKITVPVAVGLLLFAGYFSHRKNLRTLSLLQGACQEKKKS